MGRRGVAWQDELRSHQSPGFRSARQAAKITGRETEGEDKVLQSGCRPCAEFIILQQVPQCFGGSKRRPTPIDRSHTSLPVNPLPTARSRSTCVSDMSYTGTLAKGRTRGGERTKKNRAAPGGLHSCSHTSVSRYVLATASSVNGTSSATGSMPLMFSDGG